MREVTLRHLAVQTDLEFEISEPLVKRKGDCRLAVAQ